MDGYEHDLHASVAVTRPGQPTHPQPEEGKILGVELLRILSSDAVLVFHYHHFAFLGAAPVDFVRSQQPFYSVLGLFYEYGFYGVEVFWCMSGSIFFWKCSRQLPEHSLKGSVFNEAMGIARTLNNLKQLDWPTAGFCLIVVADNCSDATAAIAASHGALVFEPRDEALRGKGHALNHAFEHSRRDGWAGAVVVVDADSEASPNLLESISARLDRGANAVQVHYGVLNPGDAWRTRLISIAMGAFHRVRSRARERLRLSCGIRGNGWCVTHALLRRVSYEAFSLTEDIEYCIALGMRGERVHYCDESHVNGEMVTNSRSAGTQRRRWEQGRFAMIRECTGPLLRAAVLRPSRVARRWPR